MNKVASEFKIWFSTCCYAQLDVTGQPGAFLYHCQLCGRMADKLKLTREERRERMFRKSQHHVAHALYVLDIAMDHYREHDEAKGKQLAALVKKLCPFTREEYAAQMVPMSERRIQPGAAA